MPTRSDQGIFFPELGLHRRDSWGLQWARYLLCGLEKQMMLPAVVFFFRPENCNVGLKDATEVGLSFEEYCVDLKVLLCLVLSL